MRAVGWSIALAVFAGVGCFFPLFHIVPLKQAAAEKAAATFNATDFAVTFWTNQFAVAISHAVKVEELLAAIQVDAAAAKKKYSRTVGLGGSYFYFVMGSGTVLSVSDDEVDVAVTPGATNAEISLQTGLVFGNAIRDSTGLLNASDYPDSQDFNDISAALNHIVETHVLPILRDQAKVGAKIAFAGSAEVADESSDLHPLKVVPVQTGLP